jgi:hypothetical protein
VLLVAGLIATAAAALLLAGCSQGGDPTPTDGPPNQPQVVATTTVLADLVRSVGGDRVGVTALVSRGGEVHTFDPSPSDLTRVANADLIVANGLGLDRWLTDLARDVGRSTGARAAPSSRFPAARPGPRRRATRRSASSAGNASTTTSARPVTSRADRASRGRSRRSPRRIT